jgi:hypothetical protein
MKFPEIPADDFARRFSLRATNLMWFLGAGASASAGIPTASDMVWDFKQRLYISQRRVSPKTVTDLANPAVRMQLQAHIDASGRFPTTGAPDEYAALFEAVYPAEGDRRTYLESKLTGAKSSYAHMALATLMRSGLARLVWTTNFDTLVADACARVYDGTGYLTTITLDAPELARQCLNEGRWPAEVKLHGDFRSRRLKNTADELRLQDERLRQIFTETCTRFGLVVAGYSGRDTSVMEALQQAIGRSGAFPAGLFWLHRGESDPYSPVADFLMKASEAGIETAFVRIENFDEVMRDLLRTISGLDTTALEAFARERRRWSAAPAPIGNHGWPVLRLNALPFIQIPNVCRRLVCAIGGYTEIRAAVDSANVDLLIARTKAGVLGFGKDSDMRAAFDPFGITDFDLHTIEQKRLRYDSGERGLLREAFARAITRHRGMVAMRKRNAHLFVPADPNNARWQELRKQVGTLTGTVPKFPDLRWFEAIESRLEWADDRLWLLFDPRTAFEGITDANRAAATDFGRERTIKRYNRQLNSLIVFWASLLGGTREELRAFGIGDGVDAVFKLSTDTAFSKRVGA